MPRVRIIKVLQDNAHLIYNVLELSDTRKQSTLKQLLVPIFLFTKHLIVMSEPTVYIAAKVRTLFHIRKNLFLFSQTFISIPSSYPSLCGVLRRVGQAQSCVDQPTSSLGVSFPSSRACNSALGNVCTPSYEYRNDTCQASGRRNQPTHDTLLAFLSHAGGNGNI